MSFLSIFSDWHSKLVMLQLSLVFGLTSLVCYLWFIRIRPFKTVLPNGQVVWCTTRLEAIALYDAIFNRSEYFAHGIHIRDNDTVVDVGAHIGLFSLCASYRARNLRLLMFEPIPYTYQLLKLNRSLIQQQTQIMPEIFNFGLAGKDAKIPFNFSPYSTFTSSGQPFENWSTLFKEGGWSFLVRAATSSILDMEHYCHQVSWDYRWFIPLVAAGLRHQYRAVRFFATSVALWYFMAKCLRAGFTTHKIDCQVRRLSDVLKELHPSIDRINLLKVDVEGAELDVLKGIDPSDWSRIDQIVLEVEDHGGSKAAIASLLEKQGFAVSSSTPEEVGSFLTVLHNSLVYGTRKGSSPQKIKA